MAECPSGNGVYERRRSAWCRSEKQGASGQAGPGEGTGAGIVFGHRSKNLVEVVAEFGRHHVELVGNGKLQITPTVGHQLGQLRFLRSKNNRLRGDFGKQGDGLLFGHRRSRRNQLGQGEDFTDPLALLNAFRTEGDFSDLRFFLQEFDERVVPG